MKNIFDYEPSHVGCFAVVCFFIILSFWKAWELVVMLVLKYYGAC